MLTFTKHNNVKRIFISVSVLVSRITLSQSFVLNIFIIDLRPKQKSDIKKQIEIYPSLSADSEGEQDI